VDELSCVVLAGFACTPRNPSMSLYSNLSAMSSQHRDTSVLQFVLQLGCKHGNAAFLQLVACACFVHRRTNAASSTVAKPSLYYSFVYSTTKY